MAAPKCANYLDRQALPISFQLGSQLWIRPRLRGEQALLRSAGYVVVWLMSRLARGTSTEMPSTKLAVRRGSERCLHQRRKRTFAPTAYSNGRLPLAADAPGCVGLSDDI